MSSESDLVPSTAYGLQRAQFFTLATKAAK
jgi:hypothetical protein